MKLLIIIPLVFLSAIISNNKIDINKFEIENIDKIPLSNDKIEAIKEYMLYSAYSKDADYAANAQRAASHYSIFERALGNKSGVDKAANPEERM